MITNISPESPIGVFDSGLGGLTVLKSLENILPNESFIYLGDTAHVPYGNKSVDTVVRYSRSIMDFFLKNNVKAVVIACNTASAVAYSKLCKDYDIPIFDVVLPSVIHANRISETRNVGIIGTHSTVFSKAYTRSFKNLKSDCSILEIPCPLFVPLIEEGWSNTPIAREIAKTYLKPFQGIEMDVLILGCTHYPIMTETIKNTVKNNVKLICSGKTVGTQLLYYLKKNKCDNVTKKSNETRFYVTDFPKRFDELGSCFLERELKTVEHISLM